MARLFGPAHCCPVSAAFALVPSGESVFRGRSCWLRPGDVALIPPDVVLVAPAVVWSSDVALAPPAVVLAAPDVVLVPRPGWWCPNLRARRMTYIPLFGALDGTAGATFGTHLIGAGGVDTAALVESTQRPLGERTLPTRVFVPGVSLRASPSIHATPRRDAIEGRRASYFWPPRVSDGTAGTTFGVGRPDRTAPRTPIAAPEVPTRLERGVIGWAVSGTAGRLGTLFHMLHRPGGDWSRQRMSSEEKRAEEADDDLVNHPSEKNQAPTTVSASSPSPPERVATPSDRERLWPGSWRRQRGSPPLSVTDSVGTSHSDWACHIS